MHIETPDVIEFSSGFNNPPGWENPDSKTHCSFGDTRQRPENIAR